MISQRHRSASLFLLLVSCLGSAAAAVTASIAQGPSGAGQLNVVLTIDNRSGQTACINGAAVGLDGGLGAEMFKVLRNGEPAESRLVQMIRTPSESESWISLVPGQRMSVVLDLAAGYDFTKSGTYSIQYNTWSIGRCGPVSKGIEFISNVLTISRSKR